MKVPASWQRDLKRSLEHIVWCEMCGSTQPPLDLSHRMKRRFILTKEEFLTACKLCRKCHNFAEHGSHERLKQIHDELIAKRDLQTQIIN